MSSHCFSKEIVQSIGSFQRRKPLDVEYEIHWSVATMEKVEMNSIYQSQVDELVEIIEVYYLSNAEAILNVKHRL